MMSKIAVLMPVYNAEHFLAATLDSILRQTEPNFEFLIVDDCSTDRTGTILQEYAARDPRLRLLANPKNSGIATSRNTLFAALSDDAEFIALMDADDLARPDRLARQRDFLVTHPEIDAVGANLAIIDEAGRPVGSRYYPETPEDIQKAVIRFNPISQSSLMLRRRVIDAVGAYDPACRVASDYDYWLRALGRFRFANLAEPVIDYRLSAGQCKQKHMKRTLATTLRLQRKYLFRPEYRSVTAIVTHFAKYPLFLIPGPVLLALFTFCTYRRQRRK